MQIKMSMQKQLTYPFHDHDILDHVFLCQRLPPSWVKLVSVDTSQRDGAAVVDQTGPQNLSVAESHLQGGIVNGRVTGRRVTDWGHR